VGEISIFLGGQAGEGIKRGALTIGKVFNRYGYRVFIMDDYGSIIRGGQDYSEIRVSSEEVLTSSGKFDFMFAFHKDVYERYKDKLKEGGIVILDGEEETNMPFQKFIMELSAEPFMKSSVVIGALSFMAGLPFDFVEETFEEEFKDKSIKNVELAKKGFEFALEHNFHKKSLPRGYQEPLPILYGNDAIGLGAVRAGMKVYTAYPITPTSTLLDFLAKNSRRFGISVVHAEDEIAAIMMAIGASYASAPSMVGSSGPGIDLMGEAISLAGGAEVPLVILDVQRAGPTTGMPTYTEQGDLNLVLNIGHGEFPRIVLVPGDIEEAFELTGKAFQYAWWYQIPVFILSDKHLSESAKTCEIPVDAKFNVPIKYFDCEGGYKRYQITDDGISPIAFPGMKGIINHTNSTEHTEEGYSSALPDNVKRMKEKRLKKMDTIKEDFLTEDCVKIYGDPNSKNILISFGSTKGAILEAIEGLPVKFLQVQVLEPFPIKTVKNIFKSVTNIIDIEQNTTAQFGALLYAKTGVEVNHKILRYDGRPFEPLELRERIEEALE
jgi:2-oxoglutarate ferredoxin oxidoreductase subunit alpha